jgi:hypothetical protein
MISSVLVNGQPPNPRMQRTPSAPLMRQPFGGTKHCAKEAKDTLHVTDNPQRI